MRAMPRAATESMAAGHRRLREEPGLPAAREARATCLDDDALPMTKRSRVLKGGVGSASRGPVDPRRHGAQPEGGGDQREEQPARATGRLDGVPKERTVV